MRFVTFVALGTVAALAFTQGVGCGPAGQPSAAPTSQPAVTSHPFDASSVKLAELPTPTGLMGDDSAVKNNDGRVLSRAGDWKMMAFGTETMMPMPRGWEVYDTGDETNLFYPPVQMTVRGPMTGLKAHDVLHIDLKVRNAPDFDAIYDSYIAGFKEIKRRFPALNAQVTVGPRHHVGQGAGYFLMLSPQNNNITICCVAPKPRASGLCNISVAIFDRAKWETDAPIVEQMVRHWLSWDGDQMLPELKLTFAKEELALFGVSAIPQLANNVPATTQPAVVTTEE